MTSAYFRLISWHFNSRYSQASGDMYDGWGWNFRKLA
jgi:hypothetical protein